MFRKYTLRPRRAPRHRLSLLNLEDRINPAPGLTQTIEGLNFTEEQQASGSFHIPPDPYGAASSTHVVSVVNQSLEFHQISDGATQLTQSLRTFFGSLVPPDFVFDPKVIYDQFENRFVLIALDRTLIVQGAPPTRRESSWLFRTTPIRTEPGTGSRSRGLSAREPIDLGRTIPASLWMRKRSTSRTTCSGSRTTPSLASASGSLPRGQSEAFIRAERPA